MISPATMNLNTGGNRVGRWSRVKMSALPPKADMCSAVASVRFGPKADISLGGGPVLHVQVQGTRGRRRLSDFNEVSIWIAHVTPQFRRMNLRLCNEFRAPRRPKVIIASDVCHAQVQKNAENILTPWRRCKYFGLIVSRTTADVNDEPDVAELQECRFALAQHRGAEDVTVKCD